MNKTKEAILLAVKGLLFAPLESVFVVTGIFIPFVGIILCIAAVIGVARFIDKVRKEFYPEMDAALFTACAYIPGLVAAVVFFILMFTLPRADNDINGYGALARGILGGLALISQISLSIAGWIYDMKSRDYSDFS